MSNSAFAVTEVLSWVLLSAMLFVLLVSTVLVLRSGSVAGPDRLEPGEPIGSQASLTLFALTLWILIPGLYGQWLEQATASATTPAAQPNVVQFTPAQSVRVSIASALIVSTILIGGNLLFRDGGLRRLGLWPRGVPRGVAIGLSASVLVLPASFLAAMVTDNLWNWLGLKHPGAHEMLKMLVETDDRSLRRLIYVSAILVAPFFEELLFRGHVQTLLVHVFSSRHTGAARQPAARWLAIIIASALFTLVHGALWMMPPIFLLALCLGYIYERTANLWAPIVVHMLFNAANVVTFINLAVR